MEGSGKRGRRGAGRPRVGEEPLTRGIVIEAALRLVDEEGMGALSMRRLGAELGVDPMSIYHHLPGKGAVVSGLVEKVFGEMAVPAGGDGSWQEGVRGYARAHRELALAHPNLVLQIVSSSDLESSTEAMLAAGEPIFEALVAAGLTPRGILAALDVVADYVHGFVLAETAAPSGHSDHRGAVLELLRGQPSGRYPAMRRVFEDLGREGLRYDFDSGFEAGLDIIVAGIEHNTRIREGGVARP